MRLAKHGHYKSLIKLISVKHAEGYLNAILFQVWSQDVELHPSKRAEKLKSLEILEQPYYLRSGFLQNKDQN